MRSRRLVVGPDAPRQVLRPALVEVVDAVRGVPWLGKRGAALIDGTLMGTGGQMMNGVVVVAGQWKGALLSMINGRHCDWCGVMEMDDESAWKD